ncbi:Uu.00g050400.m01.CDS01 [Anthostomella pinea]|uniref:Uu.00g050400.m01.CDS01 n=1 Tax=Anthostomella pinea TaxID=933095 RepID=A0AAI8YML5_9PEZI|nr:Uu.00g050400.m01.CDS01 [Anthostomella pinea]
MRPPAPSLDVIAARNSAAAAAATSGPSIASASASGPNPPTMVMTEADEPRDSRSSSSTNSPAPADNEESDFFLGANDSQSSLGVVPNMQDMQVTDPECLPTVAALPSEILISIFSRISNSTELLNCMLTCKRWARNAVEILWHRPTCTSWEKHAFICNTLGLEKPFFTYSDFIKRLNLAALAPEVNDGSVLPLSACSRVERLTLTNCKGLTDSGLIPLVGSSQFLLALDISGDINITEASIMAIAKNCRRLQGLNISNCKQISNESMVQLAENCKYIKRLKLNDCVQLNDNAILAFAHNCPNILEIDLHQCDKIGNDPVTALLARGQSLRELRLSSCELIDDAAFLTLPSSKTYEHLRILDLTSCSRLTDRAVEKIIDVAPRLRNLVLAKCNNITDAAVFAISRLGKNLHYVHLGHCRNITDEAVKRLVQCCNRIRYIDLGCCTHLTDDSVTRLATLPKLKRIGLVKCASITDESMYALAKANYRTHSRRDASNNIIPGHEYRSSSLERVHLSYCTNLTLPSIIKLLNCCPKLTHLSLTGVPAFLRDDLEAFCREAPVDFTDHQRAVFCVFSGAGVAGLRRYLNTREEFAEYHEGRRHERRRALPPPTPTGGIAPGPIPDIDGFEEIDTPEDDDMGEGSEIALDNGNPGGDELVDIATIPPPPPHHSMATTFSHAHPIATPPVFESQSNTTDHPFGTLNGQWNSWSNQPQNNAPSSLDQIAVPMPGPSTAGSSLFGRQGSAPGPSTASMQAHIDQDDETRDP